MSENNTKKQLVSPETFIQNAIANVQNTMENFSFMANQIEKMGLAVFDIFNTMVQGWQKWIEVSPFIFQKLNNFWVEFEEEYSAKELDAIEVLQKYKWFISPNMPFDFVFEVMKLGQKKDRQDKNMNKLFVNYFSQNNWQNLELISEKWGENPLFKKRFKIIQDCIQVLKAADRKTNAVNVILPTLISQIDGFLTDYLDFNNILYKRSYDDFVQKNIVKKVGRKSQFRKKCSKVLSEDFDDLAKDLFLNILFQRSGKGKTLEIPFNFNRHQIMHGENVKYGKMNYLVRAFMLLDYLISLSLDNKKDKIN